MRKLMLFVIGFAAIIAICVYLNLLSWMLIIAVIAGISAIALCFIPRKTAAVIAAILFGISAGCVYLFVFNTFHLQTARLSDGQTVSGSIEISDYSYERQYGIAADGRIVLEEKSYKVRVYLTSVESLSPGDVVSGDFKLHFTVNDNDQISSTNPGKGLFLLAYERDEPEVTRVSNIQIKHYPVYLRQGIRDIIDKIFPEDTVGFARALFLGDSSKLSYEVDTDFKVSGIRHIVAVSGLHVSILMALICMFWPDNRMMTAIVGLPILLVFAAVTGFTPSVTRACIMQALMMLALWLKQDYDPPTALAFAVLVILICNPLAITSVSLQLSAGCIVGIFAFSKPITDYIVRLLRCPKGMSLRSRLTRWFAGSIAITLSAVAVTTPLCAYYFGMVSIVGVITNLLTLWIVSLIFYGIMLSCVLGAIFLPLGQIAAFLISWLMRYVLLIANALASLPIAAVYTCSIYIVIWLIASYVFFGIFLIWKRKRPAILALCVIGSLFVALIASWIEPRLDNYRVTVLDVGQGQCILLQVDEKYYMVDCGGDNDSYAADVAAELLLSQGVTRLDGLLITHYDRDHTGGVIPLLSRVEVDTIYLPAIRDDGKTKEELKNRYSERIYWVSKKTKISGDWGTMQVIPGETKSDKNENSMCILFQPGNCDILITGDRNIAAERALLEAYNIPELEVLVVGHHGSKSSTGFELLSKTKPKMAIISVGQDNPYGNPAKEVLDRLELFDCEIWRTDLHGTIVYRG